jgi:hypothetical protein
MVRLYDAGQVEIAKAKVPLWLIDRQALEQLSDDLEGALGKGWME